MRKVYLQSNLHGVKEKRTTQSKLKKETKNEEFMVVLYGSQNPPLVFHDNYDEALREATRLSTKENKRAYVVKVMAMVELLPKVTKY